MCNSYWWGFNKSIAWVRVNTYYSILDLEREFLSIILSIWNIFLQGRSFTNYPQWTGLSHHVAFHYYVQICAGKWFLRQPGHWIDRRDRNSCHICGWRWVSCCLINGGIYLNKESEDRVQVSQCSLCSWTTSLSCSMLEGRAQPLGRTDFSRV